MNGSTSDATRSLFGCAAIPRILNVGLTFIIIHLTPLEWYGLHNINMMFFVTLTEWFRTQAFRRVLLRYKTKSRGIVTKNLLKISFGISTLVTILCALQYLLWIPDLVLQNKSTLLFYQLSVLLHTLASFTSAIAEYPYIVLCHQRNHRSRLMIEMIAALVHTCTLTLVMLCGRLLGTNAGSATLVASGLAQLAWAATSLGGFVWSSNVPLADIFPSQMGCLARLPNNKWIDEDCKAQLKVDSTHAMQKGLMSEADKLLMMRYFSYASRGAISLVSGLGGFLLRLLFQPQEDILAVHYSTHPMPRFGDQLFSYFATYRHISLAEFGVGIAAALFGPIYSEALLKLVYGPKVAENHVLLGR
eukprot:Blabericola_migrator_1__423@NODE_1100_length_5436_cov_44_427454_g753_i0_p2_GENE_NODE_1100_length_5436_cov_44_427454_g753_i0NODE_1100_length_5436_cov_44_427454_g753_i0_p2_ORF_typecomplete_len360_score27_50Rft1/PF04506_13/2_5e38_NODE_1100_length_5436_cov_44_427454_g753_i08971976